MKVWKNYGKLLVIPAVGIVGVGAGAVGGAFAFDHFAARYLWPPPENMVVIQAQPELVSPADEVIEIYLKHSRAAEAEAKAADAADLLAAAPQADHP